MMFTGITINLLKTRVSFKVKILPIIKLKIKFYFDVPCKANIIEWSPNLAFIKFPNHVF